jgi:hypothetical protein
MLPRMYGDWIGSTLIRVTTAGRRVQSLKYRARVIIDISRGKLSKMLRVNNGDRERTQLRVREY